MDAADSLEKADIALGRDLSSQKDHPWVKALAKVGDLGDQEPLYALGAAVTLGGLVCWHRRSARLGVSMLLAAGAADLLKTVVKKLVRRTRPWVFLEKGRYQTETGGTGKKPEQSFPSGHAAGTTAVAQALGREFPGSRWWSPLGVGTIGLARMAKGSHWPLDVAAGCGVGLGAEFLSSRLLRLLGVGPEERGG